ncbi:hypothetical protein PCYB_102220 [Plasmodium cynomolgi strain B]|uniref:Uncharacterized protein n=1 Tax=Plasmodium cynomolgi (strain B) TaxID=1120755 RepID=K6VCC1_PLACD|nr:hypothetical protein PCYB_102220 [Plasmodium cynomolgi strain B]GAB66872.1 hypothetical protein PCYB_102220 [Plasmodium cynomolgi strain B]
MNGLAQMNGPCPVEAAGVDPQEPPTEELINVRKTFLEEEADEYTKSSRRYLQDEENYVNRIKTYNVWNCPWKGKLMDLKILHLDGESLKRDKLLREYQNVATFMQNGTNDVPYVDIKKTISDFLLIVKKHLTNEDSKKKFMLFNSYVELFKSHYVEIFKSHKNLVDQGIHLIRSNYLHLKNHLVDEALLNSLSYDPLDVHTYINIVADTNGKEQKISHPNVDLNMYLKIVNQLKNYEFEDVNIYKLIALFGWTYKISPQGEDPNVTSEMLYCRYCFREVNLGDYSTLSRRHNKVDLFKAIDMNSSGEDANLSVDDARDALERLTGLADGWVEVDEGEADESDSEVRVGAEKEAAEKGAVEKGAAEKEEAEKEAAEKEAAEKEAAEKEGEDPPGEENNGGEKEGEEPPGEENNGGEKKGNENVSEDAKADPNEGGGTKDLPTEGGRDGQANAEEQEGFSFKWSIKQFFLPKKSIDNADKNQSAGDTSQSECPPTSVNQGELTPNGKGNPLCAKKRRKKKVQLKNILSRVFLEVSSYTEDENLFSKAAHDCYVLRGGPHLAHLDKERTSAEDGTGGANCTDDTAGCENTGGTTQKRTIRAFNLIENHRAFCPYMTEDLYSFSKITRLLFELVMSEFQRRYVMR